MMIMAHNPEGKEVLQPRQLSYWGRILSSVIVTASEQDLLLRKATYRPLFLALPALKIILLFVEEVLPLYMGA
jgi:hypothetical protein